MSTSVIKTSFASGEVAPGLYGHTDLAKVAAGCSTLRNCFVNYRQGASSRAGKRFVGQCLADGDGLPPRVIKFSFSVLVGYGLEFSDRAMRVVYHGGYVTEAAKAITGIAQSNPCNVNAPAHGFSINDWVFAADIGGMTALNGRTFIVASVPDANHVTLNDTFGDPVNSFAYAPYTSGGTLSRIFTLATPWAIADIPWLKVTQSADVMTICCINQTTGTEYPPYDLARLAADNWTLTQNTFGSSIPAPANCSISASTPPPAGQSNTQYQAVVTAVDGATGDESVASPIGTVNGSANIALTAGSLTINWIPVTGAAYYNVYLAPAAYNSTVPIGSFFGFIGSALGEQFLDQNVVQDFNRTPPTHQDPFARGAIIGATPTATGGGYVQATTSVTINTTTGSGAVVIPVVVATSIAAYIIASGGKNYAPTDTMTVVGAGSGATATLRLGPQSGTYPSVPAYFQQSRMYANTLNAPDTYFKSQPGGYQNFDTSNPPVDTDAVTGTPWAQQVNGVQWIVPMPGGAVMLTGNGAWQVSGTGGGPLTPSDQQAESQAFNGISPTVQPIRIDWSILYVQQKGAIVRSMQFDFYVKIYKGSDLTILSNHLFQGRTIVQWDWAQEPWRVAWVVRDNGTLLSFTYLPEQEVAGWARHDTNGLYVSVAVVSEPPVDAPYFIVKRFIAGKGQWAYYMERMDDRAWPNAEAVWAVDCGLALPQETPSATLSAGVASGTNVVFRASASVFAAGNVGDVIRMGGGKATVTAYVSPTQVRGDITMPITDLIPNNPLGTPKPAPAGAWTISTPVTTVAGLDHLEGMLVTGLADGAVITPTIVAQGQITLPRAASAVVVGLSYQAQIQTMILDMTIQGETAQGKRKHVEATTVRLVESRGVKVGTTQPNASEQQNQEEIPWGVGNEFIGKMIEMKVPNAINGPPFDPGPGAYLPLFTGDLNELVDGDWEVYAMVACQQDYPLPMNVIAVVPEATVGDS